MYPVALLLGSGSGGSGNIRSCMLHAPRQALHQHMHNLVDGGWGGGSSTEVSLGAC